jgi:hypothetical protein
MRLPSLQAWLIIASVVILVLTPIAIVGTLILMIAVLLSAAQVHAFSHHHDYVERTTTQAVMAVAIPPIVVGVLMASMGVLLTYLSGKLSKQPSNRIHS